MNYGKFFPKTEKYISLFTGDDDQMVIDQRNKLRGLIKANLAAAASSGVELEGKQSHSDVVLGGLF